MGARQNEELMRLEQILTAILPQEQAEVLAEKMLKRFGKLKSVLEADADELVLIQGVTMRTAQWITLLPALCRYCGREAFGPLPQLDNVQTLGDYCKTFFTGKHFEQSYLICMNGKGKLIKAQMLQRGTLTESHLYLRQLVEVALLSQAACVALTHNHPGGTMAPSPADVVTTQRVSDAMRSIEVALVDHIIVAGNGFLSMRKECGLPEGVWGGLAAGKYLRNEDK